MPPRRSGRQSSSSKDSKSLLPSSIPYDISVESTPHSPFVPVSPHSPAALPTSSSHPAIDATLHSFPDPPRKRRRSSGDEYPSGDEVTGGYRREHTVGQLSTIPHSTTTHAISAHKRQRVTEQEYTDNEGEEEEEEDELNEGEFEHNISGASDAGSDRSDPRFTGGTEGLLVPLGKSFHVQKKRTRTLPTSHQSAELNKLLAETPFPTTARREELGRRIGLPARKVQVWFQNRRQKARRERIDSEGSLNHPQASPPESGPSSGYPRDLETGRLLTTRSLPAAHHSAPYGISDVSPSDLHHYEARAWVEANNLPTVRSGAHAVDRLPHPSSHSYQPNPVAYQYGLQRQNAGVMSMLPSPYPSSVSYAQRPPNQPHHHHQPLTEHLRLPPILPAHQGGIPIRTQPPPPKSSISSNGGKSTTEGSALLANRFETSGEVGPTSPLGPEGSSSVGGRRNREGGLHGRRSGIREDSPPIGHSIAFQPLMWRPGSYSGPPEISSSLARGISPFSSSHEVGEADSPPITIAPDRVGSPATGPATSPKRSISPPSRHDAPPSSDRSPVAGDDSSRRVPNPSTSVIGSSNLKKRYDPIRDG